jgi:transcriptional regulator with PAS, ATPase and Fis domain
VLQNREITRIGGSEPIPIDVRIIAATNKDLQTSIRDHTFREDLYYRLNVVPIQLAPLRERKEDIEVLLQHFLGIYNKKYGKHIEIYSDALHMMEAYSWPGNIRELENVVERLVVINQNNVIDKKTLSMVLGFQNTEVFEPLETGYDIKAATASIERLLITRALAEFGSKRKAAAALGIDHSTLVKKCQRYGM